MRLWRIAAAAHAAFDGEGARRYGGRWSPKGLAVIYASSTLSLAALERFVHTEPDLDAADLVAIPIDADDRLRIQSIERRDLPPDWRAYPAPEALTRLGADWFVAAGSAILAVPSALIPHERNYLINPAHADFHRLIVGTPEFVAFDPRMWRRQRSRSM